MATVTSLLRAELMNLQNELENDPRFRRMRAIEDFLAKYEGDVRSQTTKSPAYPTTKAAKIRLEIKSLMETIGPVTRGEILEHLRGKELIRNEVRPLKTVGTYLNKNRDIFTTDGRGNWHLKVVST
jgi:hypothetical protein